MIREIKERIESIRRGEVPEGYKRTKAGVVPNTWELKSLGDMFLNRVETNCVELELLSITADKGVVPRTWIEGKDNPSEDKSNYKHICIGDIGYNTMRMWQGVSALSSYDGIVSPAYTVLKPLYNVCSGFYSYLFKLQSVIDLFYRNSQGLVDDTRNLKYEWFRRIKLPTPFIEEQQKIAEILQAQDKVIELKEKLLVQKQQQKKYLTQQLLTGKIRLSGFTGEWRSVKLSAILKERSEIKGAQNLCVCSVAVREGVVDQIKHLGRSFAAASTSHYRVVYYGDIVYTKSPTGDFPFGIVKQSQLNKVVVSPLYGVFEPKTYSLGYLLHSYFEQPLNTNNYLRPLIQKGAKNTINISDSTFLSHKLSLPMEENEQTAIAEVLFTADAEIGLLKKDIEQEKLKKKSLMQLLLTGIVRV